MISIDVIQRSAQMLLPDLNGCYWMISIHENTHGEDVNEIYGPEALGKTILTLSIVTQAQKAGMQCAFIDAEHALDPLYAKELLI